MITEIRIDNFAIIQHLEVQFQSGLTTFTGETGAGKSIILDAIEAVVGGRADATSIRAGADRASVEATFKVTPANREEVHAILKREELLDDPDFITLTRELRREGRSTARVNGRSASTGLLRELGSLLVDIHGQSEHLSLLNVRQHLGLLDRYANDADLLVPYQKTCRELSAIRRELGSLRQMEQDALRRTDLLNFQVNEIDAASLVAGEEDTLRQERSRLANAESLASLAQETLNLLDEGSPEAPPVTDQLGQIMQALGSLSRIDASQSGLSEQAELLAETAAELSRDLRVYLEGIEFNPRRLDQIEERLEIIHNLKRKYGGSIEAILAFGAEARRQLETIAHASERIEELEKQESAVLETLSKQAAALSERRKQAAVRLSAGIEAELNGLSMAGARFSVDFRTEPAENGLTLPDGVRVAFDENGADRVEFLIAPNPGEGLKPLVKIASGGETSRLMLALKNVLARADFVPTLIFDEIDQGISGQVGVRVGEKLWQLGREHQVLCVTHLPQLAAFGDQHFRVSKQVQDGRTLTVVEPLADAGRTDELAQMLGSLTDANRKAAVETLAMARARAQQLQK